MRIKRLFAWAIAISFLVSGLNTFSISSIGQSSEDTVYIAMQQDISSFNIFDLSSGTVWKDYVIGRFAFESLSALDPEGNIYLSLADTWLFWETNLTVVIPLRRGVKFHDYASSFEEVTADDVVFSYTSLRQGTIFSKSIINAFDATGDGIAQIEEVDGTIDYDGDGSFEGITRISEYTVKMVMGRPYAQFFLTTLGIPIIPEHIWNAHVDAEGRVDTLWSNEDATIGTGPFYYKEGQQDAYRIMARFDGYWGTTEITPSGHRLFPAYVKEIYYKVYSSLDSSVQALKTNQVDHVLTSIPHDYVLDLANNPNTDLRFVSDNGYFYMAFNQKREPMNHLYFRRAVSHVIDKETIVNRYLGGYGRTGDSVEPPFWTDWYNSSVQTYPFDFISAQQELIAGGFTDIGTSLKMPDGRPVPPLVIMTPPEDYDPVRVKAGELIAKNLRSLGMDVVAMPLDFDALVSKLNAFDYDMLIIGWSLTSDPIGNVFDILGPLASQNYFGFWSTTNENPYYNTIGGVSTLADSETQYLADLTHEYGVRAKQTFDRWEQMKWTKAGQGVISEAIPVNVLYYIVNIYGISTRWWDTDTWISFLGELLNVYSMGELTPAGGPPTVGDQITSMLFAPDRIHVDQNISASVVVLDDVGQPLPGANVTLTAPFFVTLTPTNGISNASGILEFTINTPEEGYFYLSATATFGGYDFTDLKMLQAVKGVPDILYLTVTPASVFLRVTESTSLSLVVVDGLGNPVDSATVTLDESLMGHGTVDSPTIITDPMGQATMIYSAPSDLSGALNRHLKVRLSLSASKMGYYPSNTNTVTQYITIYNPLVSDWHFVKVESVSDFAMDSVGNTSTITVFAHDSAGAPLAGENIDIAYTNVQDIFDPIFQVFTDGTGHAVFDVTFKIGIDTTATRITMKNGLVLNGVGCAATLLFRGVTIPPTPIYGGVINFNTTPLLDPNGGGILDATISLYDIDGNIPMGDISTTIVIGEPDLGTSAWLYTTDPWIYNSQWDYAGIQSSTSWDASNIISGGYFLSDLMTDAEIDTLNRGLYTSWQALQDDWWTFVDYSNMKGVTITNGLGYFTVAADDLLLQDSVSHVLVVPNGRMGFYVVPDFSNYYWVLQGDTTLSTEFATKRAMSIVSPHMMVDRPVMKSVGANSTSNVDVTVYDQDNNPVAGADVQVYVHAYGERPFFLVDPVPVTDGAGRTSTIVRAQTQDTMGSPLHNPVKQPLYAKPDMLGYAIVTASSEIFNIPVQLFLELDHAKRLYFPNPQTAITATVMDEYGTPMESLLVIFNSDNGTLNPDSTTTDILGHATVQFDFAVSTGFQIAVISACTSKEGYSSVCASSKIEGYNINTPSTIEVTSVPYSGHVSTDGDILIEGNATDPEGVDTIHLILDNATWVDATDVGGHFLYTFNNLDNGTHVVEVRVTDSLGAATMTWVLFTVDIPAPPPPQPPTGSIIINDGDEYSTSTSVILTLTYDGGSSAVSGVRYSNDGVWDTENWEAPSPTRSWTLESGDGTKIVYYQIENTGSLLSPMYSDDIKLDTEAPDVVHVSPEDGLENVEVTTTIVVTFSEKMDESSTGAATTLMKGQDEVSGITEWSTNKRRLTFTPTEDLKEGATYRIILSTDAEDLAGHNLVAEREFSFETVSAEEVSFLGQYWWAVLLIVVILAAILLAVWMLRKRPPEQEEISPERASDVEQPYADEIGHPEDSFTEEQNQ